MDHFYPFGLSTKLNENMEVPGLKADENWLLLPFSHIINRVSLGQVNYLILDLEGGEWDVFETLLSSDDFSKMNYLSLRIR